MTSTPNSAAVSVILLQKTHSLKRGELANSDLSQQVRLWSEKRRGHSHWLWFEEYQFVRENRGAPERESEGTFKL